MQLAHELCSETAEGGWGLWSSSELVVPNGIPLPLA